MEEASCHPTDRQQLSYCIWTLVQSGGPGPPRLPPPPGTRSRRRDIPTDTAAGLNRTPPPPPEPAAPVQQLRAGRRCTSGADGCRLRARAAQHRHLPAMQTQGRMPQERPAARSQLRTAPRQTHRTSRRVAAGCHPRPPAFPRRSRHLPSPLRGRTTATYSRAASSGGVRHIDSGGGRYPALSRGVSAGEKRASPAAPRRVRTDRPTDRPPARSRLCRRQPRREWPSPAPAPRPNGLHRPAPGTATCAFRRAHWLPPAAPANRRRAGTARGSENPAGRGDGAGGAEHRLAPPSPAAQRRQRRGGRCGGRCGAA